MKKVLIVEDDPTLRSALVKKMSLEQFQVFQAEDGEEGLETARRESPDCILLDILMPKMNGIVFLEKLRENVWGKDIPVIVLTNSDANEHLAAAMEKGVTVYLAKSDTSMEEIVKRVGDVLQ